MARKLKEPEPGEPYLIGYARVSTLEQSLDLQIDALRKAGVHPDHIHQEQLSATSKNRPALDLAIKDLRPGDTLIVWRLDRLARSMQELYRRLGEIKAMGASLRSLTESFDFESATGQLMMHIFGAMAQFERQLTVERTQAGLRARIARGQHLGREPTLTPDKLVQVERQLKKGLPTKLVASNFGVVVSTIYSYFKITHVKGKRIVTRKAKD
jgi:DNA invertase Pin-like site-specific DNA recombinase